MTIEVLASTVVDRGRARIGVARCELHVMQRNASVESGHDERGSEHVRMHGAQPGAFADRTNPAVRGASIEPLSVPPAQDGPLTAFAHGQVD
jgi:hypothetical protein